MMAFKLTLVIAGKRMLRVTKDILRNRYHFVPNLLRYVCQFNTKTFDVVIAQIKLCRFLTHRVIFILNKSRRFAIGLGLA